MIKLHFEKLSRFERLNEPCCVAIPFRQGILKELSKVSITDGEKSVPSQCRSTAKWPDNSVKWLLVNFLANLPGNKGKDYYCDLENENDSLEYNAVKVKEHNGRLCLDTGEININFSKIGEVGIFNNIKYKNFEYGNGDIVGPSIYDNNDEVFKATVGKQGFEIIEDGPIRVVVQTKGKHYNESGKSLIDYVLRIYAFAGKPWIRMDYQIINREEGEQQELKGIEINIKNNKVKGEKVDTTLGISNYASDITYGENEETLKHLIDARQLVYEANEHIPETFYGTFWADIKNENKGGVCATIYQAQQNFPKALEVNECGIKISILPKESGGLRLLQGMAKTHKVFLHFHDENTSVQGLNVRSLQFQMPDRPVLEPDIYKEAGVFEEVFVENKIDKLEISLINKADARGKAYGILHWGDAPDPGYTLQGRGNGEPVWTNNEYDFPHAVMLMYARSKERRMLDYMLVTAEHWMDVDVCHYSNDPLRYEAQITHSASHVSGKVEPSHEWVEGLLDYYHQTGEYLAYKAAIGIGENVLRQLELPKFKQKGGINARETGWALRTLVALYKETNDEKWLEPAEKIIQHFEDWKEEYGGWLAPYTDHTTIRIPFMIAVAVGSLMRYYRIRPQEKIKGMILDAVTDMVDNCILENGLFYYKELPSLRRMGNNTLVLEALADAYELTGDVNFIKSGLATFYKEAMNGVKSSVGGKRIVGDAVIMQGPGPKGFAQSFYPIVSFYRAAVKSGIIGKENFRFIV
ncbi:hypothetical protein LL037_09220 [Clostridium estertheticum]|uniref:Uncharacterized protein n=1 Tax=Clostridium estertheticum TaxID=238834 RepID=A0AA47EGR3_9CLOT|nr:beta-L-arabinofuranosidase domain-containing protein [Clostridium estertheticum]MBU3154842.1 hypothetical protein [Clostridium estertheticum]MBU3200463.1 hypothetical protein [Clostridium estertheticum]WAG58671.1 hypothetical protein LL038_13470 [Clostridium estertheticum]WAG67291.1 hypothetical protein LL037_09220 [Clostridium estertheticum]